jgi:alanine racemase
MQPQSRLNIDLDIIRANYTTVTTRVGKSCKVAAVVKANAYGMGVSHVAPVLERAGCTFFFVATPYEAADLRAFTQQPIGVLNAVLDEHNAEFMAASDIRPVLNSLHDLEIWQRLSQRDETPYPALLQLDTGMRRVGLSKADLDLLSCAPQRLDDVHIETIMSHFASADDAVSTMCQKQHQRFEEMVTQLRGIEGLSDHHSLKTARLSLANSAGILRSSKYHYDMVRPGRALFGLQPLSSENTPGIRNPITLEGRIIQTIDVKAGESVGYNETWIARNDVKLATVSLGYADGVRRILSNRGAFYYKDQALPVIGRVSMDMCMVRIDHVGSTLPQPGEWVSFIGPRQTPDQLGRQCESNGYEILTGLGRRAERNYILRENHRQQEMTPAIQHETIMRGLAPSVQEAV